MTLPEQKSRFYLPSSIRLLLSPGIRGHSLIFAMSMGFLFATAYIGRYLGFAQAWTVVFIGGASTAGVYLVLAPLALFEKFRNAFLFSRMTKRIIILAAVYAPIVAGIVYWVYQAGTVEALPIFPAFIVIFYGWILLQAYFIAMPVSQLLTKVERGVTGEGHTKRVMRTLGTSVLFLPIAPLTYGVYAISNWLNSNYQNVQGASGKILIWTLVVTVILLATYFFTATWGWRVIKQKKPEAAIFAGGTFLVLWGYLLYRATTIGIGYVTQNQPSNPFIDTGLMLVSIFAAMQTFARKTVNRSDRRWSQVLPFIVFSFGSVYAVAQFYFILQVPITRVDLSILINATVFATGVMTMMFLIRRHLLSVELSVYKTQMTGQAMPEPPIVKPHRSLFHFSLPFKRTTHQRPETEADIDETQPVEEPRQIEEAQPPQEAPPVEEVEQIEQPQPTEEVPQPVEETEQPTEEGSADSDDTDY